MKQEKATIYKHLKYLYDHKDNKTFIVFALLALELDKITIDEIEGYARQWGDAPIPIGTKAELRVDDTRVIVIGHEGNYYVVAPLTSNLLFCDTIVCGEEELRWLS